MAHKHTLKQIAKINLNENLSIDEFNSVEVENVSEKEMEIIENKAIQDNKLNEICKYEESNILNQKQSKIIQLKKKKKKDEEEKSPYKRSLRQSMESHNVFFNEKNESIWQNFSDFLKNLFWNLFYIFIGNSIYIFYWGIFNYNLKFPMICFYEENNNFCEENEFKIKFNGFITIFLGDFIIYSISIDSFMKNKKKKIFICSQMFVMFLLLKFLCPLKYGDYAYYGTIIYYVFTLILCVIFERSILKDKVYRVFFFGIIIGAAFSYLLEYALKDNDYIELLIPFLLKIFEHFIIHLLKRNFPKKVEEIKEIHLCLINYTLLIFYSYKIGIFLIIDMTTIKFWRGVIWSMFLEIMTRNFFHSKIIYYLSLKKLKKFQYPSMLTLIINGQRFITDYYVTSALMIYFIFNTIVYDNYIHKNKKGYALNELGNWNFEVFYFSWKFVAFIIISNVFCDFGTWLVNFFMIKFIDSNYCSSINTNIKPIFRIYLSYYSILIVKQCILTINLK